MYSAAYFRKYYSHQYNALLMLSDEFIITVCVVVYNLNLCLRMCKYEYD